MKKINFNDNHLRREEIEEQVSKVRCILLNPQRQAMLIKYAGMYMLPGGSIEEGEEKIQALRREIKQETGIEKIQLEPKQSFLQIYNFQEKYPSRRTEKPGNRLTITDVYIAHTQEDIHLGKLELTESERKLGLERQWMNLSRIPYLLDQNEEKNIKKEIFDQEILTILKEFRQYQLQKQEKER